MHPNTHHHGGTHDDDHGPHDDDRTGERWDEFTVNLYLHIDDGCASDDDDHVCARHDNCRLSHHRHVDTGSWFELHLQHDRCIAVRTNGTSFGH